MIIDFSNKDVIGERYIEQCLFPEYASQLIEDQDERSVQWISSSTRREDPFNRDLIVKRLSCTSEYEMPKIKKVNTIPKGIIGYDRISYGVPKGWAIHFYISDGKLIPLWNAPLRFIRRIPTGAYLIGPDLSIRMDMLLAEKYEHSFKNKALTAWWQSNGLVVIPNVVWADKDTFNMCFDGYPSGSVISINSMGIGHDKRASYNWLLGYEEAVGRLKPTHIIRYGAPREGELREISSYFSNDNNKYCKYGR